MGKGRDWFDGTDYTKENRCHKWHFQMRVGVGFLEPFTLKWIQSIGKHSHAQRPWKCLHIILAKKGINWQRRDKKKKKTS